ncbi:hypothetical protein [Natronobacterium gregoryi]|uniref:Uncharacterized protein n=2 Tax=Natronobacterium gregoryi TaxID=44930 RepID=L0ADM6_NATGS|nr:hypothetical protein [Natronobacterium gregoryi]AFZ71956.1 hypothetical protein Natgr_0711 [Natronobacterium gregoryi SP2]ELY62547.1 hypothetical protein C490_17706 [Natronobacterium gregoryi SP2]PLK20732.1 hypothetical protein CYV19_08265 [Natronobacterium gregoryi SP2]SFJ12795.1 hypothetical protein SAMN05443661_11511 [Natronobacterium gregoryi]
MTETTWSELEGTELQYRNDSWELTGAVDVGNTGKFLEVEAKKTTDVRKRTVALRFGPDGDSPSVNPGNLDARFDRIEPEPGGQFLVLEDDHRIYRYELQGLVYR